MLKKLEKFAELLESDLIRDLVRAEVDCIPNVIGRKVSVIDGKKYIKVNVGDSGKYMIDKETQTIYGIKGYGVINKKHYYGTLDTINNYYWGAYQGFIKARQPEELENLLNVENEVARREEEKANSNVVSLAAYKRMKAI